VADGAKPLVYGQLGGQSQVYVDPDGVKVTNGTDDRIELGRLSDGTYGLRVRTGRLGSGTQTVVDDDGVAVTTGGVERVRLGALGGGDYGLRVVSSNGSTVIIDGTSNVFKIFASGTQTITGPNGNNASAALTDHEVSTLTTYSGTGLTIAPAMMYFRDRWWDQSVAGEASPAMLFPRFNLSSDEVTYTDSGRVIDLYACTTKMNGSNVEFRGKWISRLNRSTNSLPFRHYLLKEAAF